MFNQLHNILCICLRFFVLGNIATCESLQLVYGKCVNPSFLLALCGLLLLQDFWGIFYALLSKFCKQIVPSD